MLADEKFIGLVSKSEQSQMKFSYRLKWSIAKPTKIGPRILKFKPFE